jgi:hypothetical protein
MFRRWGVFDIHSIPPAKTTSLIPSSIAYEARITAFIPEAQALFTVVDGVSSFIPAPSATYLSGAYPIP